MSFNKISNGYYNSDLCKCLLAIGGAYFVELKNGVKVNISKEDYDAMADGLLSVNGVKYCDPTLVASAKHIGAKYIVEFSNGNQFSISQSDYEGLIAAGFVAIGDIYYNPDDIDKVYAVAGGYFAEMVNGQKVVMTEEEYDAIVGEEPGPEPGGLTEFVDNDSFGATSLKCNISMSNADITAVLADIANETALISLDMDGSVREMIYVDEDEDGGKILAVADMPIFVSKGYSYEDKDTGETITIPEGWQYSADIEGTTVDVIDRTTGAADLSMLLSDQSFPCVVNSEVSGWNGVIIGKNEEV